MNIISNKIDELKEDLLSDIIDIVKIPSVKGKMASLLAKK